MCLALFESGESCLEVPLLIENIYFKDTTKTFVTVDIVIENISEKDISNFYIIFPNKNFSYNKFYWWIHQKMSSFKKRILGKDEGRHNLWLSQIRCYFKLEESDYLDLLDKQGGGCGICGSKGEGSKKLDFLCVDHDHKCCNKRKTCGDCVRGLLCGLCNLRLGMLEKIGRLDLASKAEKDYLNKYKKRRKENGTRSELE
jgi:hypothetical protein